MQTAPETIYLIPGEDVDGHIGYLWCDDPAPSHDHDPDEAVEYVRKDKHQVALSEKCDAPVGWIRPERYKAECESKRECFKRLREARQIIADLVGFCERPEIVAATDGAFDPDSIIQRAKGFLSGGDR
ncbi:hypothetical protein MYE70_10350 [Marinobacter alexandrii]|uniref:hypothetical protein n=1 Tax=Marinobacter alexandrii TaxID=2570351 RepID=UPI001FFE3C62|nr:hypothetical protein [Marinobacter alexandrii]MCK2149466.1 hypothetical protein [Marinobacter alexandrii]